MTRIRNAYRHVSRSFLYKVLNYYRLNANDRNQLIGAYNKYMNAQNNRNRQNAHNNARNAASQFVTTLFQIYEKASNRPRSAVAAGIRNGVGNTVLYWLPGLFYRGLVRRVAGTGRHNQNNLK
jgi:hypothetical protein